MNLDQNSIMVIHGGGIFKDKEKTKNRWCERYLMLPDHIKNRLVLENCEKNFSIEDCLDISKKISIPIIFDTHHFECYKLLHPDEKFKDPEYYIPLILKTFEKRNIKPKFHVSEQGSGKIGHHSDYIEIIPNYLLEIPEKYRVNIDIMIEAKMKEIAIFRLYNKYPFLDCKKDKKLLPEYSDINIKCLECQDELECDCCKKEFTIKIKKNMGWCDDPKSRYYNSLIKINKNLKYEKLFRKDHLYDFFIEVDYNHKKKPFKGSAIFIHLTKNYKPTKGCIALKEKDFLILLKLVTKKTYLNII